MKLKFLMDEDFVNYKKPSMFIGFPTCSFKCCREGNFPIEVCQNCKLIQSPDVEIKTYQIVKRYLNNPITSAIVMGGMEPFDSWEDLGSLILSFRRFTLDDIVIYTGYYPDEIKDKINVLKGVKNIIIKFGRYIPNQQPHYDEVLGTNLASDNQYAERIS
jgi:hypothetical protein